MCVFRVGSLISPSSVSSSPRLQRNMDGALLSWGSEPVGKELSCSGLLRGLEKERPGCSGGTGRMGGGPTGTGWFVPWASCRARIGLETSLSFSV